jgi:two-component system, NarL family, nitrate/nitrite response regulator NarL
MTISSPNKKTVLLADDHTVIRDLVAGMLENERDFKVDKTGSLEGIEEKISQHGPYDIVLLDFSMPGISGLAGIERVLELNKKKAVILFSGLDNRAVISNAIKLGVRGIIPKSNAANSIPDIIRFVLTGQTYMPPDMFERGEQEGASIKLSSREREMLECLRAGMTNREITERVGIKDATVKLHIRTLCGKLGAKNRTQAVMIAESMAL